jgi:hypothetical protein
MTSRARRQFEETFRAIAAKLAKPDGTASTPFESTDVSPFQLQSEVLSLVARRDPDLAEKLIKSIVKDSPDSDENSMPHTDANQNNQAALYLKAASSLVNINPARAVQLAKMGLNSGIKSSS